MQNVPKIHAERERERKKGMTLAMPRIELQSNFILVPQLNIHNILRRGEGGVFYKNGLIIPFTEEEDEEQEIERAQLIE